MSSDADEHTGPTSISRIAQARAAIAPWIVETPLWAWRSPELAARRGADTPAWLKLELLQRAGSFKPRGALTVMRTLDAAALARGVTAVIAMSGEVFDSTAHAFADELYRRLAVGEDLESAVQIARWLLRMT